MPVPSPPKKNQGQKNPKRRSARLSAKPVLAKVESKPKKTNWKHKSEVKKVHTEEQKGAKGKQPEVSNQEENKEDLPTENGETKNEEGPQNLLIEAFGEILLEDL
uniref:High mobility group nucleosome binding domain 1 n=1 Tax=Monodelphis domestica TaxID=13616 RepID=A0A5F8H4T5_MONDO